MKKVIIAIDEILDFLGSAVIRVEGKLSREAYVDNLADAKHVDMRTLDWVSPNNPKRQAYVNQSKANVLIVDESIEPVLGKLLIVVKDPKLAIAKVGNRFFVDRAESGIDHTAIIHPKAFIGEGVSIGAYSIIGQSIIGDGCVIGSNVRIYDNVEMGRNCAIKDGSVLGGAGFGFERDEEGNLFRFPQIGRLILGDDVEIGANTCIDRGALSDTVIGDHTKINNLCHIAHNNIIGRNVVITGCVNVSGSNTIEDNVWIAPNASIRGFVNLGEGCVIGMGAVVTKDVPSREIWIGNPAREMHKK